MKIAYIKIIEDGTETEQIRLEVKSIEYPLTGTQMTISLVDAHKLLKELSSTLSQYPY